MNHKISKHTAATLNITTEPRFHPGQVVATPGALAALQAVQCLPASLIHRHLTGDWGVIPADDAAMNEEALKYGNRILSSYQISPTTVIWLITEADRSYTTLLLPHEY